VTQDQTYGTPIFTTMGGQSKCPGETGTSRRESEVKIIQIIPRCGPTKTRFVIRAPWSQESEAALFGVVIQNLSHRGWGVLYARPLSAIWQNSYEASGDGYCGTPFQRSGLLVRFSQQDLQRGAHYCQPGLPLHHIQFDWASDRCNVWDPQLWLPSLSVRHCQCCYQLWWC